MVDVNYIVLLAVAIIVGLAYGVPGLFADWLKNGSKIDWAKLGATVVYSIVVGVLAVQTGVLTMDTLADWQNVLTPVWTMYMGLYAFMLYVFQKVVVTSVAQLLQKTTFYPKKAAVDPARKMDADTRHWLVSDLPAANQAPTLAAVDQAEAKTTYRYAIESGAWIFLVEFGEVTGSKHYFYKGWFGTSVVQWKPITSECLETIRKTGKFPAYDDLW